MSLKRIASTMFTVLGTTIAAAVVTGVIIAGVIALSGMSGVPITIPWTIDVTPGNGAVIASASIGGGAVVWFGAVAVVLAMLGHQLPKGIRRRR
jgi:hypothetical protein